MQGNHENFGHAVFNRTQIQLFHFIEHPLKYKGMGDGKIVTEMS